MMKRTILSAALALTFTAAALAQAPIEREAPSQAPDQQTQPAPPMPDAGQPMPHGHHHPNPHMQAMRMGRELNLTPDQTAKLEPILASRDQQMDALRTNTALNDQQRHHEMHQITKSTETQFAGVLTPDQMQRLRTMHREHKQQEELQNAPPAPPQN